MHTLDSSSLNQVVLAVTAVVLLCGCAGLLLVAWSSPWLRGIAWVAGGFALGGTSAFLHCLVHRLSPWLSSSLAGVLALGCFVCLDMGVSAVANEAARPGRLSLVLLTAQTLLSLYRPQLPDSVRFHLLASGVLLAVQTCATGWGLVRRRGETTHPPELLCGSLLLVYGLLLSVRVAVLDSGLFRESLGLLAMRAGFAMTLLAFILGIAFGFFWMTTSAFAHGLERMASTDPLTRIFNRRTFLLWCEKEVQRSLLSGMPFSLLLVDLDHFKQVNDRFGHGVGDRLLCSVVERVQDGVRGIDVLSRWGGEEFAALLPRASADASLLVAERVRGNIERSSMALSEAEAREGCSSLRITASLGAATFRGPGDSLGALFERADSALYAAKRQGRNCTVSSATSYEIQTSERLPAELSTGMLQEQDA